MLAAEIGKRAPEAEPGVRRRGRNLIEQIDELADRDLLQHPQIDRARQVVIAVALQPFLDRLGELDQLDGIESGVLQRPRLGAAQAEPTQPGVRTRLDVRRRSASRTGSIWLTTRRRPSSHRSRARWRTILPELVLGIVRASMKTNDAAATPSVLQQSPIQGAGIRQADVGSSASATTTSDSRSPAS